MLEYSSIGSDNGLLWNIKWNSYIFIIENAFESVICEIVAILSRLLCVKW